MRLRYNADIAALNKATATELISSLLKERDNVGPTAPQLKLLEDLNYNGATPTTKNKASQIISEIRLAKRVKFLTERAKRRGTDPATIERLVSLVRKYNL